MIKEVGLGSEAYAQVGNFFSSFQQENGLQIANTELFGKPLKDGTIRPGKMLVRACDLPTTRSKNQEKDRNPNERHTVEISLIPTLSDQAIRIETYHEIEIDLEMVDATARVKSARGGEINNQYLTVDGWLIDDGKVGSIPECWKSIRSAYKSAGLDELEKTQDTTQLAEKIKLETLLDQIRNQPEIWNQIARKTTFN